MGWVVECELKSKRFMDTDFHLSFVDFNVNLLRDIPTCTINTNNSNVGVKSVNCYSGVVNLSDKILNDAELSLLSKGLTFVDTPNSPDMGVLTENLNKFHLSVKKTFGPWKIHNS